MKAVIWNGVKDIRVEEVPDPEIINPGDIILKVTSTAICGSDLHLYDGFIPTMKSGDILGHEFMGEVVAIGQDVTTLQVGDRVVVPFNIACGECHYCQHDLWSLCDNSNPDGKVAEKCMAMFLLVYLAILICLVAMLADKQSMCEFLTLM